ncbi:DUF2156 domain-containing protein [Caldanaerobius polysaccharolyticus]|uniref:DUF2156 domain-containing protein n=1 Tax=Caldanaerobius polysaccharolyticus TaxID=44256 RepID=UPI001FE1E94A|nr:phosphatidylglycerol lysyltransferase domain-containing protein [Caldanaerobius polysaccharolyticus]
MRLLKLLHIEDKNILDFFFKKYPPQISEYTFTNLYMWNHRYNLHYEVIQDCLCLVSQKDAITILPPVGDESNTIKALEKLWERYAKEGLSVFFERFPEHMAKKIKELFNVNMVLDEDNSDYVYNTSDLINLSGRKYHSKKNHVNRFKKLYNYTVENLSKNHVAECLSFTEKWLEDKDLQQNPGLLEEFHSIKTFFENYEIFDVKGIVVKIQGEIQGYTFGELLNPDTAVVHIEKANPDIPDLYAFINQCFAETAWASIPYINREQDMGIPGLRRAKQSYHPVKMVYKYRGQM